MREVISKVFKRSTLLFLSAVLALSALTPLASAQTASATYVPWWLGGSTDRLTVQPGVVTVESGSGVETVTTFAEFKGVVGGWNDSIALSNSDQITATSPSGVEVKIGSGAWGSTATKTFTTGQQVITTVDVRGATLGSFAVQLAAKVGSDTLHASFAVTVVDTTAPDVPTITSPSNSDYFKTGSILNTWTAATDAASYQVAYRYDAFHTFGGSTCPGLTIGGLAVSGCRDTTATQRTHTPALDEQGGVTIWVRAVDAAGNYSDWSAPVHYFYDATAPSAPQNLSWTTDLSLAILNNGVTNEYGGVASWGASSSADVDHYLYKYWNDIVGNPYKAGSEYTASLAGTSLPGVFNQGNGVHHFCVVAVDHAGNSSACSSTFTITYDTTAPVVHLIDWSALANVITPNITADDTDGDYTYSWTGSNPNVTVSHPGVLRPSFTVTADGTYTYTLTVTDSAGNATTQEFTFTYAAPVVPQAGQQQQTAPGNNAANDGFTNVALNNTGDDSTGDVQGAQTANSDVKGASDTKGAADTSSNGGMAWYWWIPIVAAIAALLWWLIAALRRRRNEEA